MRKQFEAVYRAAVEAKKGEQCDPAVFTLQPNGDYVVGMVQAAWWGYQQTAPVPTDIRESFEKAVIERLKEGGFLEVEIRVECLPRDGEGYCDGSVNAYWHFYKQSRADLVVTLPPAFPCANFGSDVMSAFSVRDEVARLGIAVAQ